ncbi:hypothetical protein QTP86_008272 [Hemibagrus guttatus]|nr:hypothetical protein QTP86_008272 [Hemibagrus guttatus]
MLDMELPGRRRRGGQRGGCPLDPIPSAMLQTISPDLLSFITTVINGSLTSGHVPTVFKKARVIPILKKPTLDPADISNYRPESWNLWNRMGMVCFLPGWSLISDTMASARISACLVDISSWMTAHQLKLNPSKTELLVIPGDPSPAQDLAISLSNSMISPSATAHNLGKRGAVRRKLDDALDLLNENGSTESRREAVIRVLIFYLGEETEDLIKDYQELSARKLVVWVLGIPDPLNYIKKRFKDRKLRFLQSVCVDEAILGQLEVNLLPNLPAAVANLPLIG